MFRKGPPHACSAFDQPRRTSRGRGPPDRAVRRLPRRPELRPGEAPARRVPLLLLVAAPLGDHHRGVHRRRLPAHAPGRQAMNDVNGVELTIIIVSFALVTVISFAAARLLLCETLMHLDEWGLGGRRFCAGAAGGRRGGGRD